MGNRDLKKLFERPHQNNYWRQPVFDPADHYMTEIYVSELPIVLNKAAIIQDFKKRLEAAEPSKTLYFIPGEDTEQFPAGTSLILAFSNYIQVQVTELLEQSINMEIRRHGIFPNYCITVKSNELYAEIIKENRDNQNRPGPDIA